MRRRYVFRHGEFVELDLEAPLPPRVAPYIMSDIRDYPSVITGEQITSRSQHREHLRTHGCIEVGNDMPVLNPAPMPSVREDIRAALQFSPERHAEAQAAAEQASQPIE